LNGGKDFTPLESLGKVVCFFQQKIEKGPAQEGTALALEQDDGKLRSSNALETQGGEPA
jgi:hypothetical protein